MSFLNLPEGVTGVEAVFSTIDTTRLVVTCPAEDCDFDGEVDAECWLLAHSATSRSFEYVWTCPWCENETAEDREVRDGEDDS